LCTGLCKSIGIFIARDIGVGGSPHYREVPAIVCQCFSYGQGFPGILVVVLVVGKHLDCSLVVNAYVNSGI
jgi:hypothetical protein